MAESFLESESFKRQKAEFDAVTALAALWRSQPAIVDDDYPEWRHRYEGAAKTFVAAWCANHSSTTLTR
jgi:hypothetical protein